MNPEAAGPGTSTDAQHRKEMWAMDDRMTVEERAARQSEIKARLSEINDEFSGAALPEETQREWDDLQAEYSEHETAITAATERAEQLRILAERQEGTRGTERRGAYDVMVHPRRPENIYDLAEVRQRARSVEEIPALYRENALRAVEQARYGGVDRERAQGQVEHLLNNVDDEHGTLARRILVTGSPVYQRAFGKALKTLSLMGLTAEEQRALSMGAADSAGLAVPFDLDPTVILTSDGSINPIRQMARVEQIVGKAWQGITSAGITVSRATEALEASDNAPTLAQPEVTPTRVQGFVPFSIEADQDWAALRSEMARLLADAKEQEEADSFINGDGEGVNPAGVIETLPAGSEVSDGGNLTSADIYAVEEALPPRFRARAQWLANKSTYNQVRQLGSASDGGDLWVRLGAGQPPELIGYPAREASAVPSRGTPDNRYLLFGDFSQFLIVDRVGMQIELIPHLFGSSNRYPTGQRGIYAIWRNSSLILVPNAFRVLVDDSDSSST